jgi:hypothetical protein
VILIDRLEGFQAGPFRCPENAGALDHLREALGNLQSRSRQRLAGGEEET